jgi:acetolactate synthase-1/2/3 large subunit
MNVAQVTAEILKREGVDVLLTYPLNPLTESAAEANIRPIVVRQERVGVHMADCISRMTSGDKVGVFCCQLGPGIENAFGAIAQAYSEAVPLVVIPGGYPRAGLFTKPNFNCALNFQHVTKHVETVTTPEQLVPALRRAFNFARNGRPGPVMLEIPADVWGLEVPGEIDYKPSRRVRSAPDPQAVEAAADALVNAKMPMIYAGQGVHYAKAWDELKAVAELLEAPVSTSLEGKSAFPETHALSLGAGGVAMSRALAAYVAESDVVFGAGASFSATSFGIKFPVKDKSFIHNTIEPLDIDKNIPAEHALLGDSKLALSMLYDALKDRLKKPRGLTDKVQARIAELNEPWWKTWMPRLTSKDAPISPYRVIWDFMHITDVANTTVTHDAGSPRDELSPFWKSVTPLGQVHPPGLRPGAGHGREARQPGAPVRELLGRRGHRHDRHGFRDLRPLRHPDPLHPVQQFLDGDGIPGDAVLEGTLQVHRHLRQLRPVRPGPGRLRRADHRPGPDRRCPASWHPGHPGRPPGAAGVHHHPGQGLFDLPRRVPRRRLTPPTCPMSEKEGRREQFPAAFHFAFRSPPLTYASRTGRRACR